MRLVASSNPDAVARDQALHLLTERAVLTRAVCRELQDSVGDFGGRRPRTALALLLRWVQDAFPQCQESRRLLGSSSSNRESALALIGPERVRLGRFLSVWASDTHPRMGRRHFSRISGKRLRIERWALTFSSHAEVGVHPVRRRDANVI